MFCCGQCFGDDFLQKHILFLADDFGVCHFCLNQDVALVNPSELTDHLSPLIDIYCECKEPDNGFKIIELLREDWSLFDKLCDADAEKLLEIILNSKNITHAKYFKLKLKEEKIAQWEELGKELKSINRFFPLTFKKLKDDNLEALIESLQLSQEDLGDDISFYRSRKNNGVAIHSKENMKAPPMGKAPAGRANPFGISYLYMASTPSTAIAELRPHISEQITIAELKIKPEEKVVLIDLRNPRKTISPFSNSDINEKLLSDLGLLVRLSQDLSKPIFQHEAEVEYLPSQFLCEYIKSMGFDGVIYRSALGDGHNYAFFEQNQFEVVDVSLFEVDSINISSSVINV